MARFYKPFAISDSLFAVLWPRSKSEFFIFLDTKPFCFQIICRQSSLKTKMVGMKALWLPEKNQNSKGRRP